MDLRMDLRADLESTDMTGTEGPDDAPVAAGAYRDAMARLASAVHLVTTDGPWGRAGFTASAVCSVSDAPPTLLVCLNRASSAHPVFDRAERLCVNTLGAGQQHVAGAFGGKRSMPERFAAIRWSTGARGLPVLADALATFECRIASRSRVGTHDVLFCEVVGLGEVSGADALVYADRRYHAVPSAPVAEAPGYERIVGVHEAGGTDRAVIAKAPEGAWSRAVTDAAK